MLFGGIFFFVAPVWFIAFLIATLTSSMEAWKVTGVCTLIFAVMVGLFSISNKLYKKDLKKNAQLNKETMKEILAEEERDLKWDHAFNRYFSLQLGLPQNDDVKLTNKIMSIFETETDDYMREEIESFLDIYFEPFAEVIESDTSEKEDMNSATKAFTIAAAALYKKLYKRIEIIDINTKVMKSLAAIDGIYDPYEDILNGRDRYIMEGSYSE